MTKLRVFLKIKEMIFKIQHSNWPLKERKGARNQKEVSVRAALILLIAFHYRSSLSVISKLPASASPEILLEIHIFRSYPVLLNEKLWGMSSNHVVWSSLGDSGVCWHLRTMAIGLHCITHTRVSLSFSVSVSFLYYIIQNKMKTSEQWLTIIKELWI